MTDDIKIVREDIREGRQWGLYDTKDNSWIGDEKGPRLFPDQMINGKIADGEILARIAAQMVDMQLGRVAVTRAREYTENAVFKKDTLKTTCNTEDALRRIEEGRLV